MIGYIEDYAGIELNYREVRLFENVNDKKKHIVTIGSLGYDTKDLLKEIAFDALAALYELYIETEVDSNKAFENLLDDIEQELVDNYMFKGEIIKED